MTVFTDIVIHIVAIATCLGLAYGITSHCLRNRKSRIVDMINSAGGRVIGVKRHGALFDADRGFAVDYIDHRGWEITAVLQINSRGAVSSLIDSSTAPTSVPLCPHCLEEISEADHYCPHCYRPVSGHAATDPLGQVFALGDVVYQASRRSRTGVARKCTVAVFGAFIAVGLMSLLVIWFGAWRAPEPMYYSFYLIQPDDAGFYIEIDNPLKLGAFVAVQLAVVGVYAVLLWRILSRDKSSPIATA